MRISEILEMQRLEALDTLSKSFQSLTSEDFNKLVNYTGLRGADLADLLGISVYEVYWWRRKFTCTAAQWLLVKGKLRAHFSKPVDAGFLANAEWDPK